MSHIWRVVMHWKEKESWMLSSDWALRWCLGLQMLLNTLWRHWQALGYHQSDKPTSCTTDCHVSERQVISKNRLNGKSFISRHTHCLSFMVKNNEVIRKSKTTTIMGKYSITQASPLLIREWIQELYMLGFTSTTEDSTVGWRQNQIIVINSMFGLRAFSQARSLLTTPY